MPAVLRLGAYQFYFWSHELNEPPHIHVDRDDVSAKFWLRPVSIAVNRGFKKHEVRRLKKIISEHEAQFLEAWHEHFRIGR